MTLVIILLIVLLFAIIVARFSPFPSWSDEVTTVTTVTTESAPSPNVAGPLKRQVDGDQFFVIDPVDQKKIWINSNDDMYEDAAGKIWRLV